MPFIDMTIAALSFGGGIYLGMRYKDTIQKWWMGAEGFVKMLEDKAAAVKAAVK